MSGFDEPFLPGVSLSNRRGGVMRQPFCDFTFRLVGRSVWVVRRPAFSRYGRESLGVGGLHRWIEKGTTSSRDGFFRLFPQE
jgi:hypothetical protein